MANLTQSQVRTLEAVNRLSRRLRRPPNIREVVKELEVSSTSGVWRTLEALRRKGLVEKSAKHRGVKVTVEGGDVIDNEEAVSLTADARLEIGRTKIILEPRQRSIIKLLKEHSIELAEIYRDTCLAVKHKRTVSPRILYHAIREIGNRLPDFFGVPKYYKDIKYHEQLTKISEYLPAEQSTGQKVAPTTGQVLPGEAILLLRNLFTEDRSAAENRETRARLMFMKVVGANNENDINLLQAVRGWDDLLDRAGGLAHIPTDTAKASDELYYIKMRAKALADFETFQLMLFSLLSPFFEPMDDIDKALKRANTPNKPTPNQVKQVLPLLQKPGYATYFYQRLSNPLWVAELRKNNQFSFKSSATTAYWPQADYLARVAADVPKQVVEIVKVNKDVSDLRVCEHFVDALTAIPVQYSTEVVAIVASWPEKVGTSHSSLAHKLSDLLAKWIGAGKFDESLLLTKELLTLKPRKRDANSPFSGDDEPISIISEWDYEQIIEKNLPALAALNPLPVVEMIIGRLDSISSARSRRRSGEEYSWIWRPAIERHKENHGLQNIKQLLVTGLRDVVEKMLIESRPDSAKALDLLVGAKSKLVKRIALHSARMAGSTLDNHAQKYLLDKVFFDDLNYRHEYALLAKEKFGLLSQKNQQMIIKWILDADDVRPEYISHYQLQRLQPIADYLSGEIKKKYQQLLTKHGEPKFSEFNSLHTSWMGPTSPKTKEELVAMGPAAVLEFAKNWKAKKEPEEPSQEGLGRIIAEVVTDNHVPYISDPAQYKGASSSVIGYVLHGLKNAQARIKSEEWENILKIWMNWVEEAADHSQDEESNWPYKAMADLLRDGLHSTDKPIPIALQAVIWQALQPLVRHPDPTPELEKSQVNDNWDPASLAINSVRGEAMHALIEYGLWLMREKKDITDLWKEFPEYFDELDFHLDINKDSSLAVRSVYGQYLPWVILLSPKWFKKRSSQIFPHEGELFEYWSAAWDSYTAFCALYNNVAKELVDEYAFAMKHLGNQRSSRRFEYAQDGLSHHLVLLYARGFSDLKEGSIFNDFWKAADKDMKRKMLHYVGRLFRDDKKIPEEILERLQALWDFVITTTDPEALEALTELSDWYTFAPFDQKWTIDTLIKSLEKSEGRANIDVHYITKLQEDARKYPHEVATAMSLCFASSSNDRWAVYHFAGAIKIILKILVESKNKQAKEKAIALIHDLGQRGMLELRDLLP